MCFENRQEIDVKEQNNKTTKKNKLNFFFFLFVHKQVWELLLPTTTSLWNRMNCIVSVSLHLFMWYFKVNIWFV